MRDSVQVKAAEAKTAKTEGIIMQTSNRGAWQVKGWTAEDVRTVRWPGHDRRGQGITKVLGVWKNGKRRPGRRFKSKLVQEEERRRKMQSRKISFVIQP